MITEETYQYHFQSLLYSTELTLQSANCGCWPGPLRGPGRPKPLVDFEAPRHTKKIIKWHAMHIKTSCKADQMPPKCEAHTKQPSCLPCERPSEEAQPITTGGKDHASPGSFGISLAKWPWALSRFFSFLRSMVYSLMFFCGKVCQKVK